VTHSKLAPALGKSALATSVFAAAFVVFGVLLGGCTVEARETDTSENAESTKAELRRASVAPCEAEGAGGASPHLDIAITSPTPALINPVIFGDHVLSGGNLVDDGPRPHPWVPPPDESVSGESSTGTGSADNSQK